MIKAQGARQKAQDQGMDSIYKNRLDRVNRILTISVLSRIRSAVVSPLAGYGAADKNRMRPNPPTAESITTSRIAKFMILPQQSLQSFCETFEGP
jgi:hypothetical protein